MRPLRLLLHSYKRARTMLIAMCVLLAGFQLILIVVAGSLFRSKAFNAIGSMVPAFAREMMGPAAAGMMSFGGLVCLGYFHIAIMASFLALEIALATTPAAEVEKGFIDLILARPLARHWVITRTVLLVVTSTALLIGVMLLGTWVGLRTLAPPDAPWPRPRLILSLAANLALLILAWSGIAMALGAAARRRGVAGGIAGFLALAMFLLDYVSRIWSKASSLGWWSPFRYFSPFDLLMGGRLSLKNIVILSSIAVAGFAVAYVLFARRDITH